MMYVVYAHFHQNINCAKILDSYKNVECSIKRKLTDCFSAVKLVFFQYSVSNLLK